MTNLSMAGMFHWKLHGNGKTLGPGEVVEPNERLTGRARLRSARSMW